jgi:hypothetical protein
VVVVLPSILANPLKLLHPLRKYRDEDFSVDFTQSFRYCALESLPLREMEALELSLEKTKEEEVIRGEVWARRWLRHPLGFCVLSRVIGLAGSVRTCIVQMDIKTFQ